MTFLPLRARAMSGEEILFVGDSGGFFAGSPELGARIAGLSLSSENRAFLAERGLLVEDGDGLGASAHAYSVAERLTRAGALDYMILVPTLRCNLSCTYCQVSRAPVAAPGFDWTERTLAAVLERIGELPPDRIKIEFQGGEPTLRPDLIKAVIDACERFEEKQFVICTNLSRLTPELLDLYDRPDLYISTSLDGDADAHTRSRTETAEATQSFLDNLCVITSRYGPEKVSALPTIDPRSPPAIDSLIDSFLKHGLTSVFLRPINFHGFARKRHQASREQGSEWHLYHEAFVRRIIERNWQDRSRVLEETYFSICLRRIFQPGADRHVDLRNPNPIGVDYIVVDYDGTVYPTDEARMLSRSGVIDLSIGDIETGWKGAAREALNIHSTNQFDPHCTRCAYQPYCGRDIVDDISRYGRIDLPRPETEFCRRHLRLFDLAFELIYDPDPAVRYSVSRWLRLAGTPPELGARYR